MSRFPGPHPSDRLNSATMSPARVSDVEQRLESVRELLSAERPDDAARELRLALNVLPSYGGFARAQGLIERLRDRDDHARSCRIAMLGTRTTSLLLRVLEACCFRDRVRAEVYQGMYGA